MEISVLRRSGTCSACPVGLEPGTTAGDITRLSVHRPAREEAVDDVVRRPGPS